MNRSRTYIIEQIQTLVETSFWRPNTRLQDTASTGRLANVIPRKKKQHVSLHHLSAREITYTIAAAPLKSSVDSTILHPTPRVHFQTQDSKCFFATSFTRFLSQNADWSSFNEHMIFMPQHTGCFKTSYSFNKRLLWKKKGHKHEPYQGKDGQLQMATPHSRDQSDPRFSSITSKMCSNALQPHIFPDIFRLDTDACPALTDAEITVA